MFKIILAFLVSFSLQAQVPHIFGLGDKISASKVNENFEKTPYFKGSILWEESNIFELFAPSIVGAYAEFNPNPAAATYVLSGEALGPDLNLPAIKFASLKTGMYKITVSGAIGKSSSNDVRLSFRMSDGTIHSNSVGIRGSGSLLLVPTMDFEMVYPEDASDVTISLRAKSDNSSSTVPYIDKRISDLKISVYYYPLN